MAAGVKKTHEQFVQEVSSKPIDVLGYYITNAIPILFRCHECKHEWMARPGNILSGRTCPKCAYVRRGLKRRGKNAIIEDHGDWVLVDISTRKFKSATMKIDRQDWDRIERLGYRVGAFMGAYARIGSLKTFVHSFVMGSESLGRSVDVDHINHDGTDNRRLNLRLCTHAQNAINGRTRKNNTSGVSGVWFGTREQKWIARIRVNGKPTQFGTFKNKQDAIDARNAAVMKYHGKFAYDPAQDATLQPA